MFPRYQRFGDQHRLLRRDGRPEKLATMTGVLAEEDDPEASTTTTQVSIEEAEDTARSSGRLQRRRRRCVYGFRVLTTMVAVTEE